MKKSKVQKSSIILIVSIIICLGVIGFFAFKKLSQKPAEPDAPVIIDGGEKDDKNAILNSYEVYYLNDFGFVLADFTFENNGKIAISLDSFETNDGIKLSDVSGYKKQVEAKGISFRELGISEKIDSERNSADAKLFIPFSSNKNFLILYYNGDPFEFDLNVNERDFSELLKERKGTEIIDDNYDIVVSDSFISTMMTLNGEEIEGSYVKYYTFKLKINDIRKGVVVSDAEFIMDGETSKALGKEYSSMKIENIIGKSLKPGDVYALFFELFNDDDNPVEYRGTLRIRCDEQWVEIATDLR